MSRKIDEKDRAMIEAYLSNPTGYLRGLIKDEEGFRPHPRTLFGNLPVLTGGTKTYETARLSPLELARIMEFLDYYADKLQCKSICIAREFRSQIPFFIDVAAYAKARFDNKPYNEDEVAELPTAGQIGVQALISQDLRYTYTPVPEVRLHNNWDNAVVAGTMAYFFGDGVNWYRTSSVLENRAIIALMKNCVVESGSTPSINQLQFWTAQRAYPPWRADILRDVQVECDKPVYEYHTPGAMILTPDLGTRMAYMPTRTETISPRLVGLVYAEFNYLSAMRWNV